jgi:hypothetical protein
MFSRERSDGCAVGSHGEASTFLRRSTNPKKLVAFLILTCLFTFSLPSLSQAAITTKNVVPKAGAACAKINEVKIIRNKLFTCTKVGTKRIWRVSAIINVNSTTTPTPSPSPKPKCTMSELAGAVSISQLKDFRNYWNLSNTSNCKVRIELSGTFECSPKQSVVAQITLQPIENFSGHTFGDLFPGNNDKCVSYADLSPFDAAGVVQTTPNLKILATVP